MYSKTYVVLRRRRVHGGRRRPGVEGGHHGEVRGGDDHVVAVDVDPSAPFDVVVVTVGDWQLEVADG